MYMHAGVLRNTAIIHANIKTTQYLEINYGLAPDDTGTNRLARQTFDWRDPKVAR